MKSKTKKIRLRSAIFLAAYRLLYKGDYCFSCNAILHAGRGRGIEHEFYRSLLGIPGEWVTFREMLGRSRSLWLEPREEKELLNLRLMALALAYTLAREHNLGRFKL